MAKKSLSRLVKIATGTHDGAETEFNRLEQLAHFGLLVGRSFVRNRCPVRAAALSYTTLLALIPLLAVALSVTSSLLKHQGEDRIYHAIDRFVSSFIPPATNSLSQTSVAETVAPGQAVTNAPSATADPRVQTAQKEAAEYIHGFIQATSSGALGVVGMLLLISVAIRMLASIESTFNDIWGVTRGRSWIWRVVLYWTTITLGPLLIAGGLGLGGGMHLQTAKNLFAHMPLVGDVIFKFLLPFVVLWPVFALIYLLMPNTKVKPAAAFVGGIVAGTLWHLNNLFGFLYVSRFVMYSKIYGGLGLVPVFMVGLYFSWIILLFGAQVAYAYQNRQSYLHEKLVENVNQRGREFIALRLMTLIGRRFQHAEPAATLQQISAALGIPSKLTQQVLRPLLAARLITEIAGAEAAYLPARPLDTINAHHVLRAIRAGSGQDIATLDEAARSEVYGEFSRIEEAECRAASSVSLLALVNRSPQLPSSSSSNRDKAQEDVKNHLSR
ncbi:MAG: YhjD/YihY/BrkB family envelope integrity protein [Verrucomicrobiota bacterium]|jgi:membrane protein